MLPSFHQDPSRVATFSSHVRLNPNLPPISVEDLALMLEMDLFLGQREDFTTRLRSALHAVAQQGKTKTRPRRLRSPAQHLPLGPPGGISKCK